MDCRAKKNWEILKILRMSPRVSSGKNKSNGINSKHEKKILRRRAGRGVRRAEDVRTAKAVKDVKAVKAATAEGPRPQRGTKATRPGIVAMGERWC